MPTTARSAGWRTAREGRLLRPATSRVSQFHSRTSAQSDVGPILRWVAGLERRTDHARRYKVVETALTAALAGGSRRNKLRDDPTVRGDGDALPRFDAAD